MRLARGIAQSKSNKKAKHVLLRALLTPQMVAPHHMLSAGQKTITWQPTQSSQSSSG
jgi:hypothetical protein